MGAKRKPRMNAARTDSRISSLTREIERRYGLPLGSVLIVRPSGRRMNKTSTVGRLLVAWSSR